MEEAFKKFDLDGNRMLDAHEQAEMLKALEEEKVSLSSVLIIVFGLIVLYVMNYTIFLTTESCR